MEKDFYRKYFEVEKIHWWFRARRNMLLVFFKQYLSLPRCKILDVGCGSGYLVGQLQNLGYQAHGIDSFEGAIEYGASFNIKNLVVMDAERMIFPTHSFDAVLALDILEHLLDERPVLGRIRDILRPAGMLFITVPAFQFLWSLQDEVSHHYRRYCLSQLTRLINDAGFRITKKTYFNTFLFFPIVLFRLINRWFNLKSRQSDFDINNQFFNKAFFYIFNFETRLLKYFNFPFGASILIIARKKS